jgi:hypothetical protein
MSIALYVQQRQTSRHMKIKKYTQQGALNMNNNKIIAVVIAIFVLAIGVTAVGAQNNGRGGHRGGSSELVLEYTGLTHEEAHEAIQNGSTLAELIEATGASVDDFIAAAVIEAEERLDAAVEAGRITEDEAIERAASIEEKIIGRVNGTLERGKRGGFGDGEGRGLRGGDGDGRGTRGGAPDTEIDADA